MQSQLAALSLKRAEHAVAADSKVDEATAELARVVAGGKEAAL